jgi:ribosomal protein S18 acetylase RimI-like enzyme
MACLYEIGVAPDHRQQGIATSLIQPFWVTVSL